MELINREGGQLGHSYTSLPPHWTLVCQTAAECQECEVLGGMVSYQQSADWW